MPSEIPQLPYDFFKEIEHYSFKEIAFSLAHTLIGDSIPKGDLEKIIDKAVNKTSKSTYITSLLMRLMSMPEYQMC